MLSSVEPHISQYVAHGIIAFFGALVHALDANRKGDSKTLMDFIALTIMSSFSGVMFALVGLQMFPDQVYITTSLAGMGGFLGIEGMTILIKYLKGRIK